MQRPVRVLWLLIESCQLLEFSCCCCWLLAAGCSCWPSQIYLQTRCNKNRRRGMRRKKSGREPERQFVGVSIYGACSVLRATFTSENLPVRDTLCANFWLGKIHNAATMATSRDGQRGTHTLGQQFAIAAAVSCQVICMHTHSHAEREREGERLSTNTNTNGACMTNNNNNESSQ